MRIVENIFFLSYGEKFKSIIRNFYAAFLLKSLGLQDGIIGESFDVNKLLYDFHKLPYNEMLYFFLEWFDSVSSDPENYSEDQNKFIDGAWNPDFYKFLSEVVGPYGSGEKVNEKFLIYFQKKYNLKIYKDEFDIKNERKAKLLEIYKRTHRVDDETYNEGYFIPKIEKIKNYELIRARNRNQTETHTRLDLCPVFRTQK